MTQKINNIVCNSCGSTLLHVIGKLPNVNNFVGKDFFPIQSGYLVKCKSCHLKFRSNVISQNYLNELYDGGLSEWEVVETRNDFKLINLFLKNNFNNENEINIFDIGCNRGEILGKLDEKYNKFGLEINSAAANIARKNKKLTIWENFNEIPSDQKFDVIFSSDVIEHVVSPKDFLIPLISLLNENGVLIVTTGDANNILFEVFKTNWWYCYFPEHVSFISRKWIKKFSENNNLKIIKIEKFFYQELALKKRIRLLFVSIFLSFFNEIMRTRILKIVHKTDTPNRFQIGKNVSKDHIFIVLKKSI